MAWVEVKCKVIFYVVLYSVHIAWCKLYAVRYSGHCPKNNLNLGIKNDPVTDGAIATKTRSFLWHPLHQWQTLFLCGDSDNFWDSVVVVVHRRRIYTVWGTELIQFLAAPPILHQDDLKKRMNSSFSSYHPDASHPIFQIILVQNISAARNLINSLPQAATTTFVFFSVFILLLCCGGTPLPVRQSGGVRERAIRWNRLVRPLLHTNQDKFLMILYTTQ